MSDTSPVSSRLPTTPWLTPSATARITAAWSSLSACAILLSALNTPGPSYTVTHASGWNCNLE